MKRYRLIKEYPGSPKLGEEVFLPNSIGTGNTYTVFTNGKGFGLKNPEDYPEFWEEVVERDYEIISFISNKTKLVRTKNDEGIFVAKHEKFTDKHITEDYLLGRLWDIYSVKRLSDGEVFDLSSKVDNHYDTIQRIVLEDDGKIRLKLGSNDLTGTEYTSILLSAAKKKKEPNFTTEDGVDIFEGDDYYEVNDYFEILEGHQSGTITYNIPTHKYFSTKEAAEEYIIYNKPCLSLNDFLEARKMYISTLIKQRR